MNVFPVAIKLNITADRNTEAEAPVRKAKNHKQNNIIIKRRNLDLFIKEILPIIKRSRP